MTMRGQGEKTGRRVNRLLYAGCLAMDGIASRMLPVKRPHIVIACMPKTASTFLATALAASD
tara:strand:+ start:2527 stop:2712 length:186 start_codon:yes stop_codon:yes gene_type:complete